MHHFISHCFWVINAAVILVSKKGIQTNNETTSSSSNANAISIAHWLMLVPAMLTSWRYRQSYRCTCRLHDQSHMTHRSDTFLRCTHHHLSPRLEATDMQYSKLRWRHRLSCGALPQFNQTDPGYKSDIFSVLSHMLVSFCPSLIYYPGLILVCLGLPVLVSLSWSPCPGLPVLVSLSWSPCPGLPVLVSLSWSPCPGLPVVVSQS